MGVANTKATIITNQDRSAVSGLPNILNPLILSGGKVKEEVGLVGKLAADSNNSVYRVGRVSSKVRVSSILIVCDAIAGLTAVDVGLYDTAANGGAVVSQHLFATGLDIHAGNLTATIEARWNNLAPASAEQTVWQLLGLSADPGKDYDLCLTATTAGGNAGNIAVTTRTVTPSA